MKGSLLLNACIQDPSPSLQALQPLPHHLKYRIFASNYNCKKECSYYEAVQKTEVVFSRQLPCMAVFCNDMVKKMQLIA